MYKKIMVPLDGSQIAEHVFPHLETVVKGCREMPEVILVQVVEPISIPVEGEGLAVRFHQPGTGIRKPPQERCREIPV